MPFLKMPESWRSLRQVLYVFSKQDARQTFPSTYTVQYAVDLILRDNENRLILFDYLFLSDSVAKSQFPEYILTSDNWAVSFYKIIPDYSTNLNINNEDFQFSNEEVLKLNQYDIGDSIFGTYISGGVN